MKLPILLIVGIALGFVGCAEKEASTAGLANETESAAAATATSGAAAADLEANEDWRDLAFLDHMHAHAGQLGRLNSALDNGDLDGAMTPAYWLSRHKTVAGLPSNLQPFVDRMRESASDVEEASDLATARAAAAQIGAQCEACHASVGVVSE